MISGSVKERHSFFRKYYGEVVRSLKIPVEVGDNKLTGIFDTGAESIVFKKGLPEKLGFVRDNVEVKVGGATGTEEANTWTGDFDLIFDDNRKIHISKAFILEADLPGNVDVLVGQPVIRKFNSFEVAKFKLVEVQL